MKKDDIFYNAMLARDYRFDGKFFIGVKTTGIYCRPICPAKPKRENVEFYPTALAAENAGFRPCLRCRPEAAPLSPAWIGKTAIVQRALKVISTQGTISVDENTFAEQFGVSARHLRRLFEEEIGQTPKQISDNNRLNFARKLIVETDLPITKIALSSGFESLRRFNDAFKNRFHRAPSEIRKRQHSDKRDEGVKLTLSYRPPYDWETLLTYYRSHSIRGLEKISATSYERIFRHEGTLGVVEVRPLAEQSKLEVHISYGDVKSFFPVAQKIRQMFDLDSDPLLIANSFSTDPQLDKLWNKYPGLRIPRAWDAFEAIVCTILGQLVSVSQASRLTEQLLKEYGEEVLHPVSKEPAYLFPTAEVLATASLKNLGTTEARKNTIREIAKQVAAVKLSLSLNQDPDSFKQQLLAAPGIGPWSAEYITLRALGDTDSFPKTDLILKRALEKHPLTDLELLRPWRSYVALYLWKEFAQSLSKQKKQPSPRAISSVKDFDKKT